MNSIIIPYKGREIPGLGCDYSHVLTQCLRSIRRSSRVTGINDYEVIIVDYDSEHPPDRLADDHTTIIHCAVDDPGFNKCRALNIGVDAADGEILTFLDADALVGHNWLACARNLEDTAFTRLCYRVRLIPIAQFQALMTAPSFDDALGAAFAQYDKFQVAYEAYYDPRINWRVDLGPPPRPCGPHVLGNSQFSIRRDVLRDLRWDDRRFPRAGSEDLDMITRIWRGWSGPTTSGYMGFIATRPADAMFHFSTPKRDKGWGGHETEQYQRFLQRHFKEQ